MVSWADLIRVIATVLSADLDFRLDCNTIADTVGLSVI